MEGNRDIVYNRHSKQSHECTHFRFFLEAASLNELVIGNLDRRRIPETAKIIAAAMSSNPIHVAVFQGKGEEEVRRQEAMFEILFRHATGQARVARRDRRIVGAYRMVKWPGCQPSREAADKSYFQTTAKLCDGLEKVIESYQHSDDPRKKRVYRLWKLTGSRSLSHSDGRRRLRQGKDTP